MGETPRRSAWKAIGEWAVLVGLAVGLAALLMPALGWIEFNIIAGGRGRRAPTDTLDAAGWISTPDGLARTPDLALTLLHATGEGSEVVCTLPLAWDAKSPGVQAPVDITYWVLFLRTTAVTRGTLIGSRPPSWGLWKIPDPEAYSVAVGTESGSVSPDCYPLAAVGEQSGRFEVRGAE